MMSSLSRFLLAFTSVAPALLTYALVALYMREIKTAIILVIPAVIAVVIFSLMLKYMKGNLERMELKMMSVEAADQESLSLLLIYILPLLRPQFEFSSVDWITWGIVLVVLVGVMSTGYGYHFNPLLNLMGWHFYKVGTDEGMNYLLITRKRIYNASEKIETGRLGEYIAIDLGGD